MWWSCSYCWVCKARHTQSSSHIIQCCADVIQCKFRIATNTYHQLCRYVVEDMPYHINVEESRQTTTTTTTQSMERRRYPAGAQLDWTRRIVNHNKTVSRNQLGRTIMRQNNIRELKCTTIRNWKYNFNIGTITSSFFTCFTVLAVFNQFYTQLKLKFL